MLPGRILSPCPRNYHVLRPHQYQNARTVIRGFQEILSPGKIRINDPQIESDKTIVLESGHQPNFLPHAGTWKKAFLLPATSGRN